MPRYLGQHFLINRSAISQIIAALNLRPNETVVEIGPGAGALTAPLARQCQNPNIKCQIIAIEKDRTLARALNRALPQIKVIEGDALKILPQLAVDLKFEIGNWKLVGNIPYYITGKLLRILGEMDNKPSNIVLTIQKEVAERLSAHPPKMNLLAAATQIWSKPEILMNLKPKDFNPPPEVDSAIIKLTLEPKIEENSWLMAYYRLIKMIFKQPRKTVLNNLSTGLGFGKEKTLEILKKSGLTGEERPQNLGLKILLELSQKLFTF